jgi:2-dehydro-3-deoxygluconokinase
MGRKTKSLHRLARISLDLSAVESVAVLGECMLELSAFDVKSPELKKLYFGGDTLNTAFYLASSGQQVSYFTALGNDPQSHWMMRQWRKAGIDCSHVRNVAGRVPGLYMIETDPAGERSFLYWRDNSPARELFDDAQQSIELFTELRKFELVYLSGVTLSLYSDTALKALLDFLADYRRHGGLVAFDSNYRSERWPDPQRAQIIYENFYQQVDLALPTLEDDGALFDLPGPDDLFEKLNNLGVTETVIKQGGKGCLMETDQELVEIPALKVDVIVDTTGAGDAFNGGYLCARINGDSMLKAARRGHRYAAQVIQQRGAVVPIDLF